MIVQRTLDTGFVISVLTNETILDAISEDNFQVANLKVDVIQDYWLEITDSDIDIGVVQFKSMFNKCFDAHIHILPEYRRDYSVEAGGKIWEWVEENLNGCLIYANIPLFCPNVKDFLLNCEFVESGYLEKAWTKNGKQHDMWILTRRVE